MIRINCKNNGGFRRAGIFHPEGVKEYPDNTFDQAQLKLLQAEPLLQVQIIPDEPVKEDDKGEDADVVNPEEMTVAELAADLRLFHDSSEFKVKKKAALIEMWIKTRDDLQALAGKEA